ncbi:MAG: hypothetical protein Q7S02_02555 [bacterium]|nr:hypothetical protein [bacterium]
MKTKILTLLLVVVAAAGVILGTQYLKLADELTAMREQVVAKQTNAKVLDFAQLFVAQVLRAEHEVDFETRLKLETAVREISDAEILAQWNRFTASANEKDAQAAMKELLSLLLAKMAT